MSSRRILSTALASFLSTSTTSSFSAAARGPLGFGLVRSSFLAMSSTTTTATASVSGMDTCTSNPLLSDWSSQPFRMPPFSKIEPKHYKPALEEGMNAHLADLQAIVDNTEEPSFDNTLAAYDRAGKLLGRVRAVFSNMCSSLNTEDLQKVQTEMAPILSRHRSQCIQLPGLFTKIDQVYQKRNDLGLSSEQLRLVERIHLDFTRAGASLSSEAQKELADLLAQLASLHTKFQQNVMKDEEIWEMKLSLEDMDGCPESLVDAARGAAKERGHDDGTLVITLGRSLVEPFLTYATRRHLRQQAFEAWTRRGELDPERDNLSGATEILKLRQRVAKIHGYPNFAAYQCADRMAKTPEKVMELLENVWERAKISAHNEQQAMEDFLKENGQLLEGGLKAYDWRFVAEKYRLAKYDLDESLLKPYLSFDRVREALFGVSEKLFGLRYVKREDVELYHPDVDLYEVHETAADGSDRLVALFVHDNYARAYKSSGAWMSEYRSQTRNLDASQDSVESIPIVSNNNNFAKATTATLLSFDDSRTMFHEFGHAHHGMLSDASYSRLASTNVATDFVELPSQLMEHWFDEREVIQQYAKHYETGEPIPDHLLDKLEAARLFQQGFQTVEYTICALLDMAVHQLDSYEDFDLLAFEKKELKRLGMPEAIVMRHRPAHFQHLFSTSSYAAGYYVYQWAEVLDADAFGAFKESGNVFDSETSKKARKFIYGAGNTVAPDELFRLFRGRHPDIDFMLKDKGMLAETN